MRDLYKSLKIKRKSSRSQVISAISKCSDQSIRDDASSILLNGERKVRYDRINTTLRVIGSIRSGTDLIHSDHWNRDLTQNYCPTPPLYTNILEDVSRRVILTHKEHKRQALRNKVWGTIKFVGIVGAVCFGIYLFTAEKEDVSTPRWKSGTIVTPAATPPPPYFYDTHSPAPRPASGTVTNLKGTPLQAPFAIETSAGADYYIKLKENGRDAVTIYVRGGENVEVDVPLGTYEMTYASGATWYGTEHHFGPDTGYSKSDSRLSFEVVGNQITGYTVTLYQVYNGNMHTRDIPKSQF